MATNCTDATAFINLIVGAEVKGVVIGYEAENEPAPYAIPCVRAAASAATVPAAAASVGSRAHVSTLLPVPPCSSSCCCCCCCSSSSPFSCALALTVLGTTIPTHTRHVVNCTLPALLDATRRQNPGTVQRAQAPGARARRPRRWGCPRSTARAFDSASRLWTLRCFGMLTSLSLSLLSLSPPLFLSLSPPLSLSPSLCLSLSRTHTHTHTHTHMRPRHLVAAALLILLLLLLLLLQASALAWGLRTSGRSRSR